MAAFHDTRGVPKYDRVSERRGTQSTSTRCHPPHACKHSRTNTRAGCNAANNVLVSMGMRKMRQAAAADEATMVLAKLGKFLVDGLASMNAIAPAFAAVSPKRLSGPCAMAGPYPR